MRIACELCLGTAGKQVPSGPDWIHEVKHDGYRLLVLREDNRVRLLSRNGTDWTRRYPWTAETALKNRQKRFVIDGEAVILGVDGISDFNALHSRKHDHEVQLYAFDILAVGGDDLRVLPLHLRKTSLESFWRAVRRASPWRPSSAARSARTYSERRAAWVSKAWSQSFAISRTEAVGRSTGSRLRTGSIRRWSASCDPRPRIEAAPLSCWQIYSCSPLEPRH
ncbi:ATP-dependent DNA ligase [Bradyrhizobium sp. USDA 4448]